MLTNYQALYPFSLSNRLVATRVLNAFCGECRSRSECTENVLESTLSDL